LLKEVNSCVAATAGPKRRKPMAPRARQLKKRGRHSQFLENCFLIG
jgi:hypothetical protein